MAKQTSLKESATRKKVDNWLKELGWNTDEESVSCNVFTERAKTESQNKKFKRKRPDYVLYRSGTDEPLAIIEAKRKGQSVDDALNQAIKLYAEPLGIYFVFAIDGTFVKSIDLRVEKELTIDSEPLKEIVSEEKLLRFLQEGNNITEVTAEVKYTREELIKTFKWANDLLRKEGIQKGIERFTAFSNLLFIKIISEIEEDREKRGLKRQLKKSLCWDSFANMEDAEAMLNYINNTVLRDGLAKEYNHSDDIFQEKLKIQNSKTVKKIVKKLSELTLINTESEIKGDAFEYFLKSLGTGNDLGEYFTPRHIVKTMVNLSNPKFGNTVFDPFCGTGGFLIEAFRHIKRGIDEENNKFMDQLKNESIFGVELTESYKIAKMNMIITGDGHSNIVRDDTSKDVYWSKFVSPRDPPKKSKLVSKIKKEGFDIIISNIPYSQQTDYGSIYPIPSNQGDSIFLQHLILKLKKGGICAVVVPEGLLFKANHKKVREYLTRECDLQSIISLPPGVFLPYANVKTSILIFKKGVKTKKVWFFNVENDGFKLNNNRKKIKGRNDLDILQEKYRASSTDNARDSKYFWVDIKEIKDKEFNLSFTKYRKFEHAFKEHRSPKKILGDIIKVEDRIVKSLEAIKKIL